MTLRARKFSIHAATSALFLALAVGGGAYGLLRNRGNAAEAGGQFYVSPSGTPAGDGSLARPWDLQTALNENNGVQPGDTIWLRGGTYSGAFVSNLNGAPGKLITVRQYPSERAVLTDVNFRNPKKDTLNVQGTYTAFWGFEVTTYDKDKAPGECWDDDRSGDGRAGCIQNSIRIDGPHNKFINLIVHDTNIAFGGSKAAGDIEYYGNLIYNAGRNRNEHGIYPQNNDPLHPKNIIDNVFFNMAGDAIHLYGVSGALNGFNIEGNTFFSSDAPLRQNRHQDAFIRVGGALPARGIAIRNNCFYSTPDLPYSVGIELGYTNPDNDDVVFKDNYMASSFPLWVRTPWKSMTVTGNTLYSYKSPNVTFSFHTDQIRGVINQWDYNQYIYTPPQKFQFTSTSAAADGGRLTYTDWADRMGLDAHSEVGTRAILDANPPAAFVRPNKYEAGRGFITVYNWDKSPAVSVDISKLGLRAGQKFTVSDVQNVFGAPVYTGTYGARSIRLSMTNATMAKPSAQAPGTTPAVHTSPEFGVFLVQPVNP